MAVFTIALKTLAWYVTGSVGLLSDAMESLVNQASAVFGLVTFSYQHIFSEGHCFALEAAGSGVERVTAVEDAPIVEADEISRCEQRRDH